MNEYKQKLRSYTRQIRSITTIENLSNEFFYEIFDYLDGYDIYNGFSKLNSRLQRLLNSSTLLYRIKLYAPSDQLYESFYKQLKFMNKQQILSFSFLSFSKAKDFFSSFSINSIFSHLESLTLQHIESDLFMPILRKLPSLPRLSSLILHAAGDLKILTDIYQIVFTLPKLKYYYCFMAEEYTPISLAFATNEQFSAIAYLVLDHMYTFEQLAIITSYTPKLTHLKFMHPETGKLDMNIIILPMKLSYLTHLSIRLFEVNFDDFERFIIKIECQLKCLSLKTSNEDTAYLDDKRWENFILTYMPQLEKFYLKYLEYIDYEKDIPVCHEEPHRFDSIFWIQRKWIYEVSIEEEDIVYSIHPYKQRWYDDDLSKSGRLVIRNNTVKIYEHLSILDICRALTITIVYHLELPAKLIYYSTLIQIIYLLPELHSVKIHSLSLDKKSRTLSNKEEKILFSPRNRCELTKVYLEKMTDIGNLDLLIIFFGYVKYFKIGCLNNIDIKLCLRTISELISLEHADNLHSLCLTVPTIDDQMIKKLDKMIRLKKLFINHTIKRRGDDIYLQWE